jgi:hypothetical protein
MSKARLVATSFNRLKYHGSGVQLSKRCHHLQMEL